MPTTQVSATSFVTREEAKLRLRVDNDRENYVIDSLIDAATELVEVDTGQTFRVSTFQTTFDGFPTPAVFSGVDPILFPLEVDALSPSRMELPEFPLTAVTSISYVDTNGATQTLSTSVFSVDTKAQPGLIILKPGQSWPATQLTPDAVTVTYTAGQTPPARAKQAVMFLVATWYENRESVVIGAVPVELQNAYKKLIWSLKMPRFA